MGRLILLVLLSVPLAMVLFWAFATRGRRDHPKWAVLRRFRYAHRGLFDRTQGVPENSMAAFRRAREAGYGVELDVHLTGDGRLAVIHDKNLLRTAGVDAEISALSVPELKRYRLEDTGEQIPLLEEVLDLFQGGPPLLVELKADYFDVSELVEKTVKLLDQYRVNYCIESFHPGVLLWRAEAVAGLCHDQSALQFPHPAGFHLLPPGAPLCARGVDVPQAPRTENVRLDGAQPAGDGAAGAGRIFRNF